MNRGEFIAALGSAVGCGMTPPALLLRERAMRAAHFAPPPRLTVSQWADRFRKLSTESSAVGGQWHSFPWQHEIMDVGGGFRRVVAMLPSQVAGKTEIPLNHIGYSVDLDPCPMLLVEPTLEMCRAISKDRVDPMFRDTPRLAGKLNDSARREKEDTILAKAGPGWRLTFVGANAAAGLAMRPIRKLFLDEPDRYPPSAGEEGDPVSLAEKRTTTFPNRLVYLTGSPTLAGVSRIAKEYEASDQRRWMVPCPACGHVQALEMGGPDEAFGLKWERNAAGDPVPESAAYLCAGCGVLIPEGEKARMNTRGRWIATHPGRDIAGFHMTALPSLALPWALLVREWYDAQGSAEELKTFLNTRLAKCYEPPGETVAVAVTSRVAMPRDAEGYPVVPLAAGLLTMGVDVQDDRLEVLVDAWGAGEETWHLGNWRLLGSPVDRAAWDELDRLRLREWTRADGHRLRVRVCAVDSGAHTGPVADYVRPRERHGVIATKGASTYGAQLLTRGKKRTDKYKLLQWLVGTVAAKDVVFHRLKRVVQPGPGYQHFGDQVDAAFLEQFSAERAVTTRRGGQLFRSYERIGSQRNEAIDLCVLTLVALYSLGDPVRRGLARLAGKAEDVAAVPVAESTPAPEPAPAPMPRTTRARTGWASRW